MTDPTSLGDRGGEGWRLSHRASPEGRRIADRHYNRQKVGSPQFVPPGRCTVLVRANALWVTSWPFAEYVRHAWPGAWVNSLFRNEGDDLSSEMIRAAIAATRFLWQPPPLGMVTFVDPKKVKPAGTLRMTRNFIGPRPIYGECYRRAGFTHVGFTKGGLWVWQLLPEDMPEPSPAIGMQERLVA